MASFVRRCAVLALVLSCGSARADSDSAATVASYFPDGLINEKGKPVDVNVLGDKLVGLYFSASWCGPCRVFTPKLIEYHQRHAGDFEIVFISSDKSEEAQFEYMTHMNWPAMKFGSDAALALKKKFEVTGIPTLVLLKHEGDTLVPLTRNGRGLVMEDVDASVLKTATIVQESYTCDHCSKTHVRDKVQYTQAAE